MTAFITIRRPSALAVATSAYLAAVFMAADAQRVERASEDERSLIEALRTRALIAGAVAGAIALGGLAVLHSDAHFLYVRLLHGAGHPVARARKNFIFD